MILVRAGSGKDMLCRLLIAGLVGFGATATAVAGPSADSAGKPCVAVLAPEVIAKMPGDERKALAGRLDTLLTESLAKRKDFVTVDRQALDKVLAEKTAKAGGLTKIDPKDVAAPLRPFWSAGILICPVIRQADPKEAAPGKMIVSVEAVLAQTGQLLASLYVQADGKNEQGLRKALAGKLGAFWQDAGRHLRQSSGKPLVDISGKLTSKITRLQWMVDDLCDAAEARVALAQNVVPLVPRQPLNTKEERLLRVMGLSAAKGGDKAAGLGAAPDIRLLMELTETVKTGVSFTKTPITLKLSLQRAKSPAVTAAIKGQVGQWEACRKEALVWVDTQVRALSKGSPTAKADDEARARKLAREELAAIKQWTALSPSNQSDLPRQVRRLILDRALRAAHLDPTSETAAYLVALHVDSFYEGSGYNNRPLACYDRTIAECSRYVDRFDQKVADHHREVLKRLGYMAVCATFKVEVRPPGRKVIFPVPNELKCHYFRIYVRACAEFGYLGEIDKRYDTGNSFQAFGYNLVHNLIPNCPQKELDQEYEYWKNFWDKKVRTVEKRKRGKFKFAPVPWEFVEATFAARRKDAKAVRAALRQLARVCPKSKTPVWGGDRYKEYIVPVYLKKAGDPQWKSWQPDFRAKAEEKIPYREMTAFMNRLRPRFPQARAPGPPPKIPARVFVVPEKVRGVGRVPGSFRPPEEILLLVDGEAWLSLPGPWASGGAVSRNPSVLYSAKMPKPGGKDIHLAPRPLPWPELPNRDQSDRTGKHRICCHLVQASKAGSTVWLGTNQGLVRFDHAKDGAWKGRWYTTRDGLPCNRVVSISPGKLNGRDVLLLVGTGGMRMFQKGNLKYEAGLIYVHTLDVANGETTILFDGSKVNFPLPSHPTAKLKDGRTALVKLIGQGVYGDVDLRDIQEFLSKGLYGKVAIVRQEDPGIGSIWKGGWDGMGRKSSLREISANTAKPTSRRAFKSQRITVFPFEPARELFGEIIFLNDPSGSLSLSPYFYTTYMVGVKDTLWIACTSASGPNPSNTREIIGYRPGAPKRRKPSTASDARGSPAPTESWIGPFLSPDGTPITNMHSAGNDRLLVTTRKASYLVSCQEAVEAARKAGRVTSPDSLADATRKRLAAAGWQGQVPALILRRQWAKALSMLDDRRRALAATAKPADAGEPVRLRLWRAHVLARMPDGLGKGIDEYQAVAASSAYSRCARVFARMNQVFLLHKAGRYKEMLDLVDRVVLEFPQVRPDKKHNSLNWYINDAKRKLKKASDAKDSKVGP